MGKINKITKSEDNNKNDNKQIQIILDDLENLVGLYNVKKIVYEIQAFIKIQKKRKEENLLCESLVLHMIFKGNPGTGKTTVARNIGSLFKELKILDKGHIVEVERADLVGEYIGHTALKTREQIKKALGGILFIDEAYSLARGGEKDFGKEAIDVLVKSMEDYKNELILILAGYKNEMDSFMKINPGLQSRFPIHIDFPDYSLTELMQIAELMLKEREYTLSNDGKLNLQNILKTKAYNNPYFGNARMVRNLIEKSIRSQAVRLIEKDNITRDDLIQITLEDIKNAFQEI
ncbi:AAA family ATPase [Desulfonispora thiosulfatigenes]|nr:AAA family ATPase [Desulfonispora thiosulfatigenes]